MCWKPIEGGQHLLHQEEFTAYFWSFKTFIVATVCNPHGLVLLTEGFREMTEVGGVRAVNIDRY
jgi:hypothetical protein